MSKTNFQRGVPFKDPGSFATPEQPRLILVSPLYGIGLGASTAGVPPDDRIIDPVLGMKVKLIIES
jgi:hypothetical protein